MGDAASNAPNFETLYRQIQVLPEGVTRKILDPGVLRTMGRPGKAFRRSQAVIADALRGSNATLVGSGWWIESEVEIRFGPRLMVPNLAKWRVDQA